MCAADVACGGQLVRRHDSRKSPQHWLHAFLLRSAEEMHVPWLDGREPRFDSLCTPQRFKCLPDEKQEPGALLGAHGHNCGCDANESGGDAMAQLNSMLRRKCHDSSHRITDSRAIASLARLPALGACGAEDESELGVFHDDFRPQRSAALEARLHEFTPADMQSAVIYADDLWPPASARQQSTHCHNAN